MNRGTVERTEIDSRLGTGKDRDDFLQIRQKCVGDSDAATDACASLIFAGTQSLEGRFFLRLGKCLDLHEMLNHFLDCRQVLPGLQFSNHAFRSQ